MLKLVLLLLLCQPAPKYHAGDVIAFMDESLNPKMILLIGKPNGEYAENLGHQYECMASGHLFAGLIWEKSLDDLATAETGFHFRYDGKKSWDEIKKEQIEYTKKILGVKEE